MLLDKIQTERHVFLIDRRLVYERVPEGKRKPRPVTEEEQVPVGLPVIQDESDFPLAFTVYRDNEFFTREMPVTPYRVIIDADDPQNFILFKQVTNSGKDGEAPIRVDSPACSYYISMNVKNNEHLEVIQESIRTFVNDTLIFEGTLWEPTSEPCYYMEYDFHGPYIALRSFSDSNTQTNDDYFRADEKQLLLNCLKKDFEEGNIKEDSYHYWTEWFHKNHIEIGDVFCSHMLPYDMKRMEMVTEKVRDELLRSFNSLDAGCFSRAPGLQKLMENIVSRIWNDYGYKERGKPMYFGDAYAEAFAQEMCAIYGAEYKAPIKS